MYIYTINQYSIVTLPSHNTMEESCIRTVIKIYTFAYMCLCVCIDVFMRGIDRVGIRFPTPPTQVPKKLFSIKLIKFYSVLRAFFIFFQIFNTLCFFVYFSNERQLYELTTQRYLTVLKRDYRKFYGCN